jgi:hypothetical protein
MSEDAEGKQKVVKEMPDQYGMITTIFSEQGNIYYTYVDGDGMAHIYCLNEQSDLCTELFSVKSNPHSKTFIYVLNDDVYYFAVHTLWKYNGTTVDEILSNINSCIIENNGIYYSVGNDVYFKSFEATNDECILSKETIYGSGAGDKMIQITGGMTLVDNLVLSDGKLYFILNDWTSDELLRRGNILVLDMKHNTVTNLCDNVMAYDFNISDNGIYIIGKDLNNSSSGILKVDRAGNVTLVKSGRFFIGIYISKDSIYGYNFDEENHASLEKIVI